MGFRSTFVTEDCCLEIPEWFYKKWGDSLRYGGQEGTREFPISSAFEAKTYGFFAELEPDLMRVVKEAERLDEIVMVWLHECGGVTRSEIRAGGIKRTVPYQWESPYDDEYGHDYCYGCSDASKVEEG